MGISVCALQINTWPHKHRPELVFKQEFASIQYIHVLKNKRKCTEKNTTLYSSHKVKYSTHPFASETEIWKPTSENEAGLLGPTEF